jgi:alpha-1,3-rhamnosyltransferase
MENPRYPLVSVIIITYNSSNFVLETLESVKNQYYRNIELIVSDDSSTDNTGEICKEWIRENKGLFVSTTWVTAKVNSGIPANCNRGIKQAKGEWIKIVAGDDCLLPDSIERYIEYINEQAKSNIEVLHSNVDRYNETFSNENKQAFRPLDNLRFNNPSLTAEDQFQILLRTSNVLAGTIFIKKTVFNRIGLYDEEARLWEDRPMLLKMTQNGIKIHYLNFCSLKYRSHSSSIQKQKKSNKFLADYVILKNTYYYQNYSRHLPFFERFVAVVLSQRVIWLDKLNLNKNKFVIRTTFRLLGFPWTYISYLYKKKYL